MSLQILQLDLYFFSSVFGRHIKVATLTIIRPLDITCISFLVGAEKLLPYLDAVVAFLRTLSYGSRSGSSIIIKHFAGYL